jgi:hypothetical protein
MHLLRRVEVGIVSVEEEDSGMRGACRDYSGAVEVEESRWR